MAMLTRSIFDSSSNKTTSTVVTGLTAETALRRYFNTIESYKIAGETVADATRSDKAVGFELAAVVESQTGAVIAIRVSYNFSEAAAIVDDSATVVSETETVGETVVYSARNGIVAIDSESRFV